MGNRRIERAFGGIGGIEMLYKFSIEENLYKIICIFVSKFN